MTTIRLAGSELHRPSGQGYIQHIQIILTILPPPAKSRVYAAAHSNNTRHTGTARQTQAIYSTFKYYQAYRHRQPSPEYMQHIQILSGTPVPSAKPRVYAAHSSTIRHTGTVSQAQSICSTFKYYQAYRHRQPSPEYMQHIQVLSGIPVPSAKPKAYAAHSNTISHSVK